MPAVVLFGATGYTGRLTAEALGRRGIDHAVAGRDPRKLAAVAEATGAGATHVVAAGDPDGLVRALDGARVLISCVGPFLDLGATAVEAALRAGTHYLDSAGEGAFVDRLLERDHEARAAGIAMVPAMGFDDVPADVAASLAAGDMTQADLTFTYAMPRTGSNGTLRTVLRIIGQPSPWLVDGRVTPMRAGGESRWAPMPPPLGPRHAQALGTVELRLAPLHLDLTGCRTYVTTGTIEGTLMRWGTPALALGLRLPGATSLLDRLLPSGGGPEGEARQARWTILAEAHAGDRWRNVAVTGRDVYGLTAETLAAGAAALAADGYDPTGVLSPVQAFGVEPLQKELIDFGVSFETFEPAP